MVLSLDRFVGKVAIVTGTSSGIGAAIAQQLVEEGLIVAGIARRSEKVEELSKKLQGKKGKLYAVKADISQEKELVDAIKWVSNNLGPVHILINNAGIGRQGPLTEGKTDDWRAVFDLNVLALSIATREAIKIMKANNINGHIIHINSLLGHRIISMPGLNVYPASKFAVTALTETLRQELNHLGSKIKITSLSPGLVESEMSIHNPNLLPEQKAMIAKMPILQAKDIADGVVYVLSTPPHVQVHELMIAALGSP